MRRSLLLIFALISTALFACNLPQPVKMRIISDVLTAEIGGRVALVAEVTYDNDARTRETVSWTSSSPGVATVDAAGIVQGRSPGTARVKARKHGLEASVVVTVTSESAAVPAGVVRVHYHRDDDSYSGWGLHMWGSAIEKPTDWTTPIEFRGRDSFGAYADISIKNFQGDLSFILHRGEEKDGISERSLSGLSTQREFWLKQSRSEVWTSKPSVSPEFIYAEFVSRREIRAVLSGEAAIRSDELSFQEHRGIGFPIASVEAQGRTVRIALADDVDLDANWQLGFGMGTQWVRISGSLLDGEFFYKGEDLGAHLDTDGSATLKLWSPPAVEVVAHVYDPANAGRRLGSAKLARGGKGVWSAALEPRKFGLRSLEGAFYQYEVTAFGEKRLALDPYARSMAAFDPSGSDKVGKGAIVNLAKANPVGFETDTFRNDAHMRNRADMVAYEIHVRDFTSDPASGVEPALRGTYLGFASKASYLKELGVSHVQFLPIQNYFTVNESDRAFRGSDAVSANYNWGYDPHNYFTPEGWLSTNAANPYARVGEFKTLVKTLHGLGIGVIVDVVYNHAYRADIFENVCPGCYLRQDDVGRISAATGAGPSMESRRAMTRRLIIDSMKHFVDEYHVDGFRFDLMGFLDTETIRQARAVLGPDVILHGEAWEFTDLPSGGVTKSNLPEGAEVGAFSDTTRDSFAGRMQGKGFVQGSTFDNHKVRSGIVGNLKGYDTDYDGNGIWNVHMSDDPYDRFARSPIENLGFLTVHDGFTLWDKINLSWKGSATERLRLARMAYAMLFTSQGRVIIHGGDEIARTKPLAAMDPYPGRAHTTADVDEDWDLPGVRSFHENSYSSPDYTNMVRWSRLASPVGRGLFEYTRGLIALKRAEPLLRLISTSEVNASLRFLGNQEPRPVDESQFAGYTSFAEVPSLTLHFVNGPASSTLYLAGEVYPAGTDKNPNPSRFPLVFDAEGVATLELSRSDLDGLDLSAWSDPKNLQVKAVTAPAQWEVFPGSYSPMGNNSIKPGQILRDNSITINLATMDHSPGTSPVVEHSLIAFALEGASAKDLDVEAFSPLQVTHFGSDKFASFAHRSLVVIHNSSPDAATVEVPGLHRPVEWHVIADDDEVDFVRGVQSSEAKIGHGFVTVGRRSTTVLARRAQFR